MHTPLSSRDSLSTSPGQCGGKPPQRRPLTGKGFVWWVVVVWLGLAGLGTSHAATGIWLRHYGLQDWETALDHDLDGFVAEEEFRYGTDPFDPASHPPQFIPDVSGGGSFHFWITTIKNTH